MTEMGEPECQTILYASLECERCLKVKAWLKKHGIAFEERVLALHPGWKDDGTTTNMAEFCMIVGNRTDLPCLVIDGVVLQPVEAVNSMVERLKATRLQLVDLYGSPAGGKS